MVGERARSMHRALGLVTLAAMVATASLRMRDEGWFEGTTPLAGAPGEICVGVVLDGRQLGVTCGGTIPEAVENAVPRLGLPRECAGAVFPEEEARHGDRLVFRDDNGRCERRGRERLSGPLRLLVGARLDVNTDTARDLTALPGIGEAKAQLIIDSRVRDGPFRDLEDLTRVRGIGPRTIERLAPFLEW